MYHYIRTIGDGISRDLRSFEKQIWQPSLSADPAIKRLSALTARKSW